MSIRHAALSIGAVLVLGLGVYLFVEVRAQPGAVASPGPMPEPLRTVAEPPPADAAPPAPRPVAVPPVRVPATGAAPPAPIAGSAAGPAAPPAVPGPVLAAGDAASAPAEVEAMAEANRAYDRGELDDAKALAARLLARQPNNVRMLRIMVSASCIDGDSATAQASFAKLPAQDQAQMRVRCARYGVSFPGP